MIGEGGVQLLADDAADEIAKYRHEIRTESVGAVYGGTGAFNCATRAGKLAPAPPDVPDSKDGRRLEKPVRLPRRRRCAQFSRSARQPGS